MRYIVSKSDIIKRKLRNKKPKPLLYPASIEIQYQLLLRELVIIWKKEYNSIILPVLPELRSQYQTAVALDSWKEDLQYYVNKLSEAVHSSVNKFQEVVENISHKVINWNKKQWNKHTESVIGKTIVIGKSSKKEITDRFLEKEKAEITSLANQTVAKMHSETLALLNSKKDPVVNIREIEKKANQIALGISSFNTELYKDAQVSMGISEYIWRTMLDEKVRDSHRPLESKICSWDDPTIFKYTSDGKWLSRALIGGVDLHPGEDYNCRCYPEANFSQLI